MSALPVLAHYFGLRPWDVDRLTYQEFEMFLNTAQEMMDAKGG